MGGVGFVVVGFRVFGAPQFSVLRSRYTDFKGCWDLWTENRGPRLANWECSNDS